MFEKLAKINWNKDFIRTETTAIIWRDFKRPTYYNSIIYFKYRMVKKKWSLGFVFTICTLWWDGIRFDFILLCKIIDFESLFPKSEKAILLP